MMRQGRGLGRRVRALAAVVAVFCAFAGIAGPAAAEEAAPGLGTTSTPIKHFVVLMQENHSFDNYFGTRPGVDGIPEGVCMPRKLGSMKDCVRPWHVGDAGIQDLDHTERAFREQYRDGKLDGFVAAQNRNGKGHLAMGYYNDLDLPYYWNVADEYVLMDRYFSSAHAGSVRNHMFAVAGHPGVTGKSESIPAEGWGDIPTIFDRLEAKGISWKFYIQHYDPTITFRTSRSEDVETDRGAQVTWAPLLAYARYVDDPKLFSRIVPLEQYYEDAARGELPAVAFIRPSGGSEHPPGSVRAGQRLVRGLINQLMRSPNWSSSAFHWAYDDWGGWYDHVYPPKVDEYGYGPRVPALLVSPYAKRGYVDHTTYDFTSPLKFIQVNWGLRSLASRDAKANPMLAAFDFEQPPRPPVILSTARHPKPVVRPDGTPVYLGYASIVVAVAGLFLLPRTLDRLARRRWLRRRAR